MLKAPRPLIYFPTYDLLQTECSDARIGIAYPNEACCSLPIHQLNALLIESLPENGSKGFSQQRYATKATKAEKSHRGLERISEKDNTLLFCKKIINHFQLKWFKSIKSTPPM